MAATKVGQLDFQHAPALGFVFDTSPTPLPGPVDGQPWHDSANGVVRIRLGGGWRLVLDERALATFRAETTSIHGIADTSMLETVTGSSAKVAALRAQLLDGVDSAYDTLKEVVTAIRDDGDALTGLLSALGLKANIADLAAVATTGSYDDLIDTPPSPVLLLDATEPVPTGTPPGTIIYRKA